MSVQGEVCFLLNPSAATLVGAETTNTHRWLCKGNVMLGLPSSEALHLPEVTLVRERDAAAYSEAW